MTADRKFTAKWTFLMTQALLKGNRIKIIHTVSRDLDEMLNAIRQWMPLYMTGLIEPYYYPKKRDGIFKHTLFISPGVSAVISSSIGSSIDNAANILIRNDYMISAYAEEFNQYLSLCKPLMRIYTVKEKESYFKTLIEFEKEKTSTIIKTESLSLLTMPEKVLMGLLSRIGLEDINLINYQRQRIKIFEDNLLTNHFSEIVPMFDLETIKRGKVKISFSYIMSGELVSYTQEEYIEHLEHLMYLLKTYDNFHVKLIDAIPESNHMVYAKEDIGAIIAKTSAPPVILSVNETNMSAAFWDFLRDMIGDNYYVYPNNKEESKKLQEYIERIRRG